MRKFISFPLVVAGVLLAGCSPMQEAVQTPAEDHMKTAAFAIYMSGDYRGLSAYDEPGSGVIFFHPESKEWTRWDLGGLDGGALSFDGKNLHVKDKKNHYVVGKTETRTFEHPNAPVNIVDNQVPLVSGGAVAYVNRGYAEEPDRLGEYEFEVMITEGENTAVRRVPATLWSSTVCEDGSVWAAGFQQDAIEDPVLAMRPPIQIYRIYPNFSDKPAVKYAGKYLTVIDSAIACVDNTIYFTSDNYIPPPEGAGYADNRHLVGSSLISYDPSTGLVVEKEMSGDYTIRADMDQLNPHYNEYYAYGDNIWWVSGYGKLVKTNIHTAENTAVFDASGTSSFYKQYDKYLFRFDFNHSGDMIIYRYNLETEEIESESVVPNIDDVEKRGQFPSSLEIIDVEALLRL